ncbi:putative metalloprotease CJM1_0395 family protein [Oceanisphaera sediminis]|uniref:Metalloprotease CJM1_0395 family protein n=1 Tax=Oceanisphaera sediminis TaxID=981381 RepID=A0ABP7DYP1_9GAMM
MQLGTSLPEFSAFAAPPPLRQVEQANDRRAPIAPAEATDSFTSSDRRQQDTSPELYDRFGRARSDDAAQAGQEPKMTTGEQPANGETQALAGEETQAEADTTKETAEEQAEKAAAEQDDEALSPEQEEQLRALQLRDREVRLHEQQHAGVGGQHAGAPSYEYETGPDGKQYAVEGEVQIDLSPVADDPRATIDKMQQIKAAALAPAEPSQADKNAAARADQYIREAQAELQQPSSTEAKANAAGRHTEESSHAQSADSASATTLPPAQVTATDTMVVRNQVIAGVYGKAAQAESRSLLNLA